jgi:uncharacterized protein
VSTRPSDRIRVRRNPKKGRYDSETIAAILDRALVAHVGFVAEGEPVCIPTLSARVGDRVYIHGSRASRTLRQLAHGAHACLTVTHIHGLVLARSAFEHTVNYESVVAFGRFPRSRSRRRTPRSTASIHREAPARDAGGRCGRRPARS